MVRRWVWSRNLVNEEAMAHWELLRQEHKLRTIRRTHAHTHTQSRKDFSGRVISSYQRPLPNKHTTNTRDEHPCPQRDSNSWSQQSTGRRLRLRSHGHRVRLRLVKRTYNWGSSFWANSLRFPLSSHEIFRWTDFWITWNAHKNPCWSSKTFNAWIYFLIKSVVYSIDICTVSRTCNFKC